MGAYIDRETTAEKIEFCTKFGTKVENWEDIFNDPAKWYKKNVSIKNLPVIDLNNGSFHAFGVGYCEREFAMFMDPSDPRIEGVYLVDRKALEKESGVKPYLRN